MFVITLTILINSLIKLNIQNKRINDLNRNLAILKGKVSIDMKELHFDTSELSAEELKHLLEEQLAKEKFGNLEGIAQQYLFYWKRENN